MTKWRRVRVVDRSMWGYGPYPRIVSVSVPWICPVCGGPRGEPKEHHFYEGGDWYTCSVWDNPCGHVDKDAAVLAEGAHYWAARGRPR